METRDVLFVNVQPIQNATVTNVRYLLLIRKHKSQIPREDMVKALEKLTKWATRIQKTRFEIGYYTRTSTKEIHFFVTPSYPESIDGYLLTGLVQRMSEMNINLKKITKSQVYHNQEIQWQFVLTFEGSSLGKSYNSLYTMTHNLKGHALFPPKITEGYEY